MKNNQSLDSALNYLSVLNLYQSDVIENNQIVKYTNEDLIYLMLGYDPSKMIKYTYFIHKNKELKDEIIYEIASIEDEDKKEKKLMEHLDFINKYNTCFERYSKFLDDEKIVEAKENGNNSATEILDYIASKYPLFCSKNLHAKKIEEIISMFKEQPKILEEVKKAFKFYGMPIHYFEMYLSAIKNNDNKQFLELRELIKRVILGRYEVDQNDTFSNNIDFVVNHRMILNLNKTYISLTSEYFDRESKLYFPEIYLFQAIIAKVLKDFGR